MFNNFSSIFKKFCKKTSLKSVQCLPKQAAPCGWHNLIITSKQGISAFKQICTVMTNSNEAMNRQQNRSDEFWLFRSANFHVQFQWLHTSRGMHYFVILLRPPSTIRPACKLYLNSLQLTDRRNVDEIRLACHLDCSCGRWWIEKRFGQS